MVREKIFHFEYHIQGGWKEPDSQDQKSCPVLSNIVQNKYRYNIYEVVKGFCSSLSCISLAFCNFSLNCFPRLSITNIIRALTATVTATTKGSSLGSLSRTHPANEGTTAQPSAPPSMKIEASLPVT